MESVVRTDVVARGGESTVNEMRLNESLDFGFATFAAAVIRRIDPPSLLTIRKGQQ